MEQWVRTKEKARGELEKVPNDIVRILFERFQPFIDHLPSGHGKGHFTRDLIHLMTIFHDPEIQKYDPVELFTGMIAGEFHDIGNSVVERYDNPKNFAAHAEVGAFLFGEITKDIIPANLLGLILLAISAHTHYPKEMVITKTIIGTSEQRIRRPYDQEMDDRGNKFAMWLTQWADRLDAVGVIFVTRHVMTKSEPTTDYLYGTFHTIAGDEKSDFLHQFEPVLRSAEFRESLESESDKTTNVLEHLHRFSESPVTETIYSKYDTFYYTTMLAGTSALESFQFVVTVLMQTIVLPEEERIKIYEQFFSFCKKIDPAYDSDEVIERMRQRFSLLSEIEQSQWARGFRTLVNDMYPRYFKRIQRLLGDTPPIMSDPKLQEIVMVTHNLAQEKLKQFSV